MTSRARPQHASSACASRPTPVGQTGWRIGRGFTREAVAVLGLLLFPCWLFRDVILRNSLWIGSFDRLNGYLSVHLHYLQTIKARQLAAWDEALFLGVNDFGFAHIFPNPLTLLAALAPIDQVYWVAALMSCAMLACSGVAAYLYIRDNVGPGLPAFIGAVLYQLTASSVLRIAQNDMTFAVWAHLPVGLLFLRRLSGRRAPAILIGLTGLFASLLTFTFLQEAAYAILLLGAFALYRAVVTRSPLPPLILGAALVIATVGAFPRLYTVAQEFRQLNRLAPRPFAEVYEFQNVRPREIARWFEDGIYGRFPSEAAQLGNNINLHEGLLLHSSIFATLLVCLATIRVRGRWFGLFRTTDADAPFHLLVLALSLAVVFRPVAQAAHSLAMGVDFTHSRAAVAALPGVSVLVALALAALFRGLWDRRPRTVALVSACGVALASLILYISSAQTETVTVSRISTAEPGWFILQRNLDLLTGNPAPPLLESPPALRATLEDLTRVRLTWDDVIGETDYRIEARVDEGKFQEAAHPAPQATSEVIQNGALGKKLAFRIKACNEKGCAVPSPEVVIAIPTESDYAPFDPTRAPENFRGKQFASGLFELTWDDLTGEDSYRLEFRDADGSFREVGRPAPSFTTYRLGDLGRQVSYGFRIKACRADQCTPYSALLEVAPTVARPASPGDPQPPLAPTNLEAIATSSDTIQLSWAASESAERYRVEMQAGAALLSIIGETVSDPPRYAIGSVAEHVEHRFFVRACNVHGCSDRSNEIRGTPSAATARTPLEAPPLITAQGDGSVRALAWDAVPGATQYVVERRDLPDQPFTQVATTMTPGFAATLGRPGTRAEFRVRSCNDSGCSAGSRSVIFGQIGERPPAPEKFTLASTPDSQLAATWTPVPSATSYRLVVRASLSDGPTRLEIGPDQGTSVQVPWPALTSETWADVRACIQDVCSVASNVADLSAEPRWQPPMPPGQLTAIARDTQSLDLSWTPVAGVTEYELEVLRPGSAAFEMVGRAPGSAASYTVRNLQPESNYLIRARSCIERSCSQFPAVTAGVTRVPPPIATLGDGAPHVTWIRGATLLKAEIAVVVFLILIGLAWLLRGQPLAAGLMAATLAALMVLDAAGNAELQLNGRQTRESPMPFAADDSFTARATDLRMPSDLELATLHDRLRVDDSRSVLICDGVQAPTICTQHVSRFWQLRLADGSSMGMPARLAALPWPAENVGRRVLTFTSRERLPWGLLGLLNVRQAVIVDQPFYLSRTRQDGRPGLDVETIPNPVSVTPRYFFAANVVTASGAIRAAQALFPDGRRDVTPDVLNRSVAEGLRADETFSSDGQISASFMGDEIAIHVDPSDRRRFLVLNELYHPSWRAFVRGVEIPVYPTNVLMRGIVIEPGVETITLQFTPFFRPLTALVSLLLSCSLLGSAWLLTRWAVSRLAHRQVGRA